MNTLSKTRILEPGDEFFFTKGSCWRPIDPKFIGLQIMFSPYKEVRRPSEKPLPVPVLAEPNTVKHDVPSGEAKDASPERESTTLDHRDGTRVADSRGGQTNLAEGDSNSGRVASPAEASYLPTVISKKAHEEETGTLPSPPHATSNVTIGVDPKKCDCIWTGRNGTFKTHGIALQGGDKISILPIGKRGVGNAMIQFPVSIIPQIVEWLEKQKQEEKPYGRNRHNYQGRSM
jgi:hypothetical protein